MFQNIFLQQGGAGHRAVKDGGVVHQLGLGPPHVAIQHQQLPRRRRRRTATDPAATAQNGCGVEMRTSAAAIKQRRRSEGRIAGEGGRKGMAKKVATEVERPVRV